MAISVDELTKTSRKFYTEESNGEDQRITAKQLDGSVFTKIPASWVNIDNELGIISSTQQIAFGDKANNNSINTAKLYALYSDQSRQVKKGEKGIMILAPFKRSVEVDVRKVKELHKACTLRAVC